MAALLHQLRKGYHKDEPTVCLYLLAFFFAFFSQLRYFRNRFG